MTNLQKGGVQVDIVCPKCGLFPETVVHALLTCEEVRRTWFASPLGGLFNVRDDSSFAEWFG